MSDLKRKDPKMNACATSTVHGSTSLIGQFCTYMSMQNQTCKLMLSRSLSPGRNHLRYVCTFPFQGRQMNEQRWNKVQSLMLTSSRWSSTTNHILVIILFVVSMPCWRDWFLLQGYTISLTIFSWVQLGTSWYQILLNRELIVVTEIMETARQIYPCKSLK
jgi:hypothetical protein